MIQILEIPLIKPLKDGAKMLEFRSQLPYMRNRLQLPIIINSVIWGDLGYAVVNYCQTHDYLLVEGYLSVSFNIKKKQQIITINITKLDLFPYFSKFDS